MIKILVSNDDGINAQGIYQLATSLKEIGKVTVVAPESEKSASGHSITMHKPLRCQKIDFFNNGINAWSINGTPSDCVKFAIDSLLRLKPDLVVSGINHGSNLGNDILYSGTVSAAIEGAVYGIPSIAISLDTHIECEFETYANISKILCKQLFYTGIQKGLVMNINVPFISSDKIKGVRITKLGIRKYKNCFIKRKDPRGRNYFWLAGELDNTDNGTLENDIYTDVRSVAENYISITPIKFDLTDYETMCEMKKWRLSL